MSTALAPEQVIAVLNAYMSLTVETIARYDGYINKFVGDAILVVFNVPLGTAPQIDLHPVAGNLGNARQVEFTVLGDTVNVASRACSKAAGDQGVLTAEARAAATAMTRDLGNVALKGKGEVALYALAMDEGTFDRWG